MKPASICYNTNHLSIAICGLMLKEKHMPTVSTYPGVVIKGQIQSSAADELPEGSQVVILSADTWDESALIDPHIARRKANGWLVSNVGSVLAQQPQLRQENGRLLWRFKAFLATKGHPLRGPVGFVDVDAYTGEILTDEAIAQTIITNATDIVSSVPSSDS
jgi:hypothetical protein